MALAVERSGRGADLVLLHGWGMNAAVWGPLLPHLEDRWRVHRVDLPGHGESPWHGEGELSAWARAVVDSVPPGATWLGWSLGGQVALAATLACPEGPRAVLVVCGTPRFTRAPDWPCALAPEVLEQFARDLLGDATATVRRFLALQVQGGADARLALRRLRDALEARGQASAEALQAGLDLLRDTDLRPHLSRIPVPVAWLLGARDRLVPSCLSEHLPRLASHPVSVVQGAGHAPFLTHPRMVAQALEVLS